MAWIRHRSTFGLFLLASVTVIGAETKSTAKPPIVKANEMPPLPDGPGKAAYVKQCITCHTPRYVTMQPRFSRKVWTAEVQKMVTAYKAPVNAENQKTIVDYLVSNFGTKEGEKLGN